MSTVFIGLGTNLGDRLANLRRALEGVGTLDATYVRRVSNVVESIPWGVSDQPSFANAVAEVDTEIPLDRLLGLLKDLEASLGREAGERYGPRVIDLDILLAGDEEWQTPELTVPHPRLAERDFAVTPLLEIDPEAAWPDGEPLDRARATEGRITATLGPVPGFEELTPPLGGWTGERRYGQEFGAWEEVSSARFTQGQGGTFALDLLFDAAVLEQAGIPIGWDPLPPQEEYSPWALPRTYRLLVPPPLAQQARDLLAEVHSAPLAPPDAPADEPAQGGAE